MSKNKKRASVAAAFDLLADRFPQAFSVDPKQRRPLKIGVSTDLAAKLDGAIQRRELGFVLAAYCGSVSYLRNCTAGAERIDLNGDVTGVVTHAEAKHAVDRLVELAAANAIPQPPPVEDPSKKLSLADLKLAAQARKEAAS